MRTRIIVDSTADLVPEIKERVHIVPLTVHFGDEEYIDGVTIDHETFYNRLIESDVLPTTSQATPDAFMKEFDKIKETDAFKKTADVLVELTNKLNEFLNKPEVKDAINKAKVTTVNIAEKGVDGLKKVLKTDEIPAKEEAPAEEKPEE